MKVRPATQKRIYDDDVTVLDPLRSPSAETSLSCKRINNHVHLFVVPGTDALGSPGRRCRRVVLCWYMVYGMLYDRYMRCYVWARQVAEAAKILGVKPSDDEQTIKQAYKKAALRYHPDKCKEMSEEEATAKFQSVANALKVQHVAVQRNLTRWHATQC
jgi:hypothetical protein